MRLYKSVDSECSGGISRGNEATIQKARRLERRNKIWVSAGESHELRTKKLKKASEESARRKVH
jgi:hypothetical protein